MSTVRLVREGAAAWIKLDRPGAGNAIDQPLAEALVDATASCADDSTIRCVVLTGTGRLFCAGGDVSAFAAAGDQASAFLERLADTLHRAIATLAHMKKPLVVLVNGPAAGAGLSLALLGDIVIAARTAHFTAAYTAIGLTPDGGMSWLLPRLIGLRRSQTMILTNEGVSADQAVNIGLITHAVDEGELISTGREVVSRLVDAPTAAIGAARGLLLAGATALLDAHLGHEAETIGRAGGHAESREGVAAFLARRKPDFHGL